MFLSIGVNVSRFWRFSHSQQVLNLEVLSAISFFLCLFSAGCGCVLVGAGVCEGSGERVGNSFQGLEIRKYLLRCHSKATSHVKTNLLGKKCTCSGAF